MKKILGFATLSALALVGVGERAVASGFAVRENSAEAVGMAYAGEGALADDPSTVFNNPAGMSWLQGNWFEFGAAAAFPTVNFTGGATNIFGAPIQGNNSGDGARTALIPDGYAVYHLNDRLTAGLAVTAPFGNMIKYNSMFFGRYTAEEFSALTVDVNPNLSYKVNDRLSVGGGLSADYMTGTLEQAVNQGTICVLPVAFGGAGGACPATTPDATARIKGDDWALGYNLGLLFEPMPGTRVGATYRSKIEHQLHGDFNYLGVAQPLGGALVSSPTTADVTLPATIGLSGTHDVNDKLTLASDLQWTEWHDFKNITLLQTTGAVTAIPQHYQNSWMVTVGAQYHLTSAWTLRGGLGWDQSPVTNQYRSVSLPDQDRYMIAVGFGYAFNDRLSVDAAYTHYFASSGSINDSSFDTSATGDTVRGNYQLSIDYLIAAVKYKF